MKILHQYYNIFLYNKIFFLLKELSSILIIWFFSYGLIYLLFPIFDISTDYAQNYYFYSIFFIFWIGTVLIFLFPKIEKDLHRKIKINKTTFLMLGFTISLVLFFYNFIQPHFINYLNIPKIYVIKNFAGGASEYIFVKIFDIGLQQLLIYLSINILNKHLKSIKIISIFVGLILFILHIPTFFVDGLYLASVFLISSFLGGILFFYIFLKSKNAFIWMYSFHWLFYIILSVFTILLHIK